MSERRKPKSDQKSNPTHPSVVVTSAAWTGKHKHKIAALLLLVAFIVSAGVAARVAVIRRSAPATPSATLQSSSNLSASSPAKEYIYAGGRLLASEEPTGGGSSTLTAPSALTASPVASAQINLSWNPSTGASSYRVERTQNVNSAFTEVGTSSIPSFTDNSVTAGTAYLYRVRAVDGGGGVSAESNRDLATAAVFADDPLTSGVTMIRSYHIGELRQAINAVRATAGLGAAAWTDAVLTGLPVKAVHIHELRTNLDQALTALSLQTQAYTDSPLSGVRIKRVHIEELRLRVK